MSAKLSRRGRPAPPTDATLAQAIAWHRGGRQPTAAHPLCVCRKPVDYPPRPEFDWDAYMALTTREERQGLSDRYYEQTLKEWREACEQARLAARCTVHDYTPSRWSKPW